MAVEVNFDGLIGPTHNYSGLSPGNLASVNHARQMSHPRAAALQGLGKMRRMVQLGYQQGILLPQIRPDLKVLRQLGFSGNDRQLINQAAKQAPELLTMVYSASSMWAANAATVTPSSDTRDGKVHFTVANLMTTSHRSIEARQTALCLRAIFSNRDHFVIHDALPSLSKFGDEGAANHSRLCLNYGDTGVGMFVYGKSHTLTSSGSDFSKGNASYTEGDGSSIKGDASYMKGDASYMKGDASVNKFPARQTLDACRAVARQHGVLGKAVFVQQNPQAIDAGAFHNDVVAVANGPLLFRHELAFIPRDIEAAKKVLCEILPLQDVVVDNNEVSLQDAIESYLFNSQLLASPDGSMQQMHLIAPLECKDKPVVKKYLDQLLQDTSQPIREVTYVDVRQSMSNGGGPACLRLRVVLTKEELRQTNHEFLLDEQRIDELEAWVKANYRESLLPADLADPQLLQESYQALESLAKLLNQIDYYQF